MLMGATRGASWGASSFRPSTALSTEIAGVMTPSPYSSAAPIRPTIIRDARQLPLGASRTSRSANNATIPPSPRLSAPMIRMVYLQERIRTERPDYDRHDAHSGFGRDRSCCVCSLLEPIERAGADITVDDAERRERGSRSQLRTPAEHVAKPTEGRRSFAKNTLG